MKRKNYGVKWKVFVYMIIFALVLLLLLWLIQIVYLEKIYKTIKSNEIEHTMTTISETLESETDDVAGKLRNIASENELCLSVVDSDGKVIFSVENSFGCIIHTLSSDEFASYYTRTVDNGGNIVFTSDEENRKKQLEDEKSRQFDKMPQKPEPVSGEPGQYVSGAKPIPDDMPDNTPNVGNAQNADINQNTDNKQSTDNNQSADNNQNTGNNQSVGNNQSTDNNQSTGNKPIEENLIKVMQGGRESMVCASIVTYNGEKVMVIADARLTPVDATVNTLRFELSVISIFMLIFALVMAVMISRAVSEPIIKVNNSAKQLAKGNYDVTFDGRGYREISELSDTLNYTSAELAKTERYQQELIANVSHDLRTPLTMITAYSEVMRDLPGENTPENVQVIIEEAERLTNLVNDMLDISKLQQGVLEKNATVYNFTESIERVMERYGKLKTQDGYDISFEYDENVMVEADEFKIFQVLYNLINNAINYTGEDKKVVVRQIVKKDKVRVEVTDTGPGISKEELPNIWERYYKASSSHKRAVKGTGLGLSIVKNILKLHNASYGVESTEGEGSTF